MTVYRGNSTSFTKESQSLKWGGSFLSQNIPGISYSFLKKNEFRRNNLSPPNQIIE
jgi:hypothetical protein